MKKTFILVVGLILLIYLNNNEYNVSGNEIRFRVIANSNAARDILMKEKVVSELSNILFINKSRNETKENIINNISTIEDKIDILFKNNNYNETYNITYGLNEFPKKEYKGKVYEEGLYESLVIEIGEAKGNNYWCFLYPSLCMSDYEEHIKSEDDTVKFKIVEVIKDIFNRK